MYLAWVGMHVIFGIREIFENPVRDVKTAIIPLEKLNPLCTDMKRTGDVGDCAKLTVEGAWFQVSRTFSNSSPQEVKSSGRSLVSAK